MTRSIAARTLITTSASQITTFKGCERRWFGQFVLKLPVAQQASAAGGDNEHRAIEGHYKPAPEAPRVQGAAALLLEDPAIPKPHDGLLVEWPPAKDLGIAAAGVPVRGRMDMVQPPVDGLIKVFDWKSTSNLKYAKTAEQLRTDVQGIVYSFAVLSKWLDATATEFVHGNLVRSKAGKNLPKVPYKVVSSGRMERAYVEDRYRGDIEATVEKMQRVAALDSFDDAEPTGVTNVSGGKRYCDLYPPAGCPFFDRCSAVKSEATALFSIFGPDTSSTVPPQAGETSMSFTQTLQSRATGANQAEATDTTTAAKLELYINCAPKGLDVVYVNDDASKRCGAIVAEYNERKGTSLQSVFEIPFGEGVKALAASYQRQPLTGRVVAVTGGLLSGPVVEVLEAQAALVVRSLA